MPRDGGFHPFKGRVSRHFGDSVCALLSFFTTLSLLEGGDWKEEREDKRREGRELIKRQDEAQIEELANADCGAACT